MLLDFQIFTGFQYYRNELHIQREFPINSFIDIDMDRSNNIVEKA